MEDDNVEDDRAPVGNMLLLRDFNAYLEAYGLEERALGDQSASNMASARNRVEKAAEYQKSIHKSIFGSSDDEPSDERVQFLNSLEEERIDICSSTGTLLNLPLKPLADACETLFTWASFRRQYQKTDQDKHDTFSLQTFSHDAVEEFVGIVLGRTNVEDVAADSVVECCQIARYLQCHYVLEATVDILVQSVDNANCLSLCQLADQLDLPRLFERSMAQMMKSLGNLQDMEVWKDLTPELRGRIETMERVLRSSVQCSGTTTLYFGTLDEYLSIFAENVQYHRERLAEAKERQLEEQNKSGRAWWDADAKITRQEKRVKTLEKVLQEQKELFSTRDTVARIPIPERQP